MDLDAGFRRHDDEKTSDLFYGPPGQDTRTNQEGGFQTRPYLFRLFFCALCVPIALSPSKGAVN